MLRAVKACAVLIGIFISLIVLAAVVLYIAVGARLNRTYEVATVSVAVPNNAEAEERGQRLATIGRCRECHGYDLGGKVFIDDPALGQIYATNLTAGVGGVGALYTNADWEWAIRHGIGRDGRSLLVTPAQFYYHLSDEDLGDLIAYLNSLRPVNSAIQTESQLGPLGRILIWFFDTENWLPAEKISHTDPRPAAPAPGATAEFGHYLWRIATCQVCHQPEVLSDTLAAAGWTQQDFVASLRTGRTPYGAFSNDIMPWQNTRSMTDVELEALWLFVTSTQRADGG